ncbi:uncharacterized protein LOC122740475 [Dromiciops gliroides]|uniref:uncharacterized protein LOC122740475 n=1 Tax=Dromiciops gliroides TaxID=33562 RepID=UPI001CC5960A|nr:uncharacterized protein LOC122740475 [Dromiciops gliroides]
MGQKVTTPLSLTLDHWSEVQVWAHNQSVEVKRKKWVTICSSEWPAFNVGWPREGTFNTDIISQVEAKVFNPGPHGHPDQVPYIVTWRALASDPPQWVQPFIPPPKFRSPLTTPSAPPYQALSLPLLTPTSSSLYPALTPLQAPFLPPDAASPLIDLLTEEPPPYPEAAPAGQEEPDSPISPIAGRLRDRHELPLSQTSQAFPLREGPNGRPQYWPFTASDLYNWKQHNPSFSKDPAVLTNLIESILVTHQPTWDDCQQLLQTLLTSEEKQRMEARKNVPGEDGRPTQLPNEIEEAFPLTRPHWD